MFKLLYPSFWQKKSFLSLLLWPLTLVYKLLGFLRSILAHQVKFPAYVICVGNITTGGTGKTQIVLWLAGLMHAKKKHYVIITKAYGSKLGSNESVIVNIKTHTSLDVGDESILLANQLKDCRYCTIIASKNPVKALAIVRSVNPEYIIFDDGMQSPYFYKDLKIMAVDGTRLFGNEMLIPAGPMRQTLQDGLSSANIVIEVTPGETSNLSKQYKDIYNEYAEKIYLAKIKPSENLKLDKTKRYVAFSGIGNPDKFFESLENARLNLLSKISYPDHHIYSEKDIEYLVSESQNLDAVLITTHKDYVKIINIMMANNVKIEIFYVKLEIKEEAKLIKLLNEKVFKTN